MLLKFSGADLYTMYVGEGEAILRDIFQQARLAAPSIIFFDEADAIASRRYVRFAEPDQQCTKRLTAVTEVDANNEAAGPS